MTIKEIIDEFQIPEEWQEEFTELIKYGKASVEFEAFLGEDQNCQEAVEKIFLYEAEGFENFAKWLNDKYPR